MLPDKTIEITKEEARMPIKKLLVLIGLAKSISEAKRLIKQGGITVR